MINEEQRCEIKVQSFVWKQKMLIAGHYEFEIIIKNLSKNSEKTIYRRFSDIEWLHEGLMKYNPGCRIPKLPEKNMWANINVNNSQLLEKRRKLIEEYLNYLNNHKFLKLNPNFQIFISNEFEKNKNESGNKSSIMEKFSHISSMIPSMLKTQKMKGLSTIEDNKKLDKDRENLVRLLKATNELNMNMKEYVRINEEKTEAIKNIIFSTKSLRNFSLDFNSSNLPQEDEENSDSKLDKSIFKNMEIINNYYERNKIFFSLVSSNICDQLEKYEIELKGLIEIFERKENEETKLSSLLKEERTEELERELDIEKSNLEKLNEQLLEEILNFKMHRENDLLQIINKFIRDKSDCNSDVSQIFENKPYEI